MIAQRNLDFHIRCQVLTQHLNDLDGRHPVQRRLLDNARNHDVTLVNFAGDMLNQDFMVNASVQRFEQRHAVLEVDPAYQLRGIAFQHLNDFAFVTTTAVATPDSNQHPVAMEYRPHLAMAQENIVSLGLTDDEAKTIRVS